MMTGPTKTVKKKKRNRDGLESKAKSSSKNSRTPEQDTLSCFLPHQKLAVALGKSRPPGNVTDSWQGQWCLAKTCSPQQHAIREREKRAASAQV